MKALVTGGGGFLGNHIVRQLVEQGDEVTSFSRSHHPEVEACGARAVQGDLQDAEAVTRACHGQDVVFHVAARWGEWGAWDSFYQVNVKGTEHILQACRKQDIPKLVFTSSPSVVFDNRPHEGCDGSLPYPARYENFYAHTKAIAEQMVLKANGLDGLSTVSLRPHLVFGPGDQQLVPGILARAGDGKVPQIGDGKNLIDLTYVEDAARAHVLAAQALGPDSPVSGSIYFVTQDEPVRAWEWINGLFAAFDLPPIRRKVPLWVALVACTLLEAAYRVLPLKGHPPLTRFLAYELALSHYYDISAAKRDLGYQPQIDMAEATRRTVAHLRARGSPVGSKGA